MITERDINFVKKVVHVSEVIKNGNLEVGSAEYTWIAYQKSNLETMRPWRRELLKDSEILKAIKDNRGFDCWDVGMRYLEAYKAKYGTSNVPSTYTTPDGYKLGRWLVTQRRRYFKKGQETDLTQDRIEALEKLGVSWELRDNKSWDEWYEEAYRFYQTHGHLHVKSNYVSKSGSRLGNWIYNQRTAYNNPNSGRKITSEQIEKLNQIGMIWDGRKFR